MWLAISDFIPEIGGEGRGRAGVGRGLREGRGGEGSRERRRGEGVGQGWGGEGIEGRKGRGGG